MSLLNMENHLFVESSYFASFLVPHGAVREEDESSGASSVSKNHCLAEKRRRDRINLQLDHLRNLIPYSDKMDKAALLGSVVEQMKDLKKKAKEVGKILMVPSDFDEVTIHSYLNQNQSFLNKVTNGENNLIQASICCDDRPNLFPELTQVFKNLRLTIISADIACLRGRIKSVLVLRAQNGMNGVCISSTIQSLKGILSRIASFSKGPETNRLQSKRQRFFSNGH